MNLVLSVSDSPGIMCVSVCVLAMQEMSGLFGPFLARQTGMLSLSGFLTFSAFRSCLSGLGLLSGLIHAEDGLGFVVNSGYPSCHLAERTGPVNGGFYSSLFIDAAHIQCTQQGL